MRDETIANLHNAQAKNVARLHHSILGMDARIQALEKALFNGRGIWLAIFRPKAFAKRFESLFNEMLIERERLMQDAAKEADEERKKPKIRLVR